MEWNIFPGVALDIIADEIAVSTEKQIFSGTSNFQ